MRELLRRAWYVMRRRQFEAELEEEIAIHREMKERDLAMAGADSNEASRAARRAFGSAALAHNQARDVWVWPWLQDLAQDVRFAARLLRKDRRFTFAAVVALSLGIGANTTIFTFINTALFKDLPFDQPRQLAALGTMDARGPLPDAPGPRRDGVSYPDFQDLRSATRAFIGIAADTGGTMNLSDEGRAPERFRGAYVSANMLDIVRVKPLLGRGFLPDDEKAGAPPVLVLGYGVWQSRYGGDPTVIGRTVRVNVVPSVVVGIMPDGFRFPMTAEVWQPLQLSPGLLAARRDARTLNVTGRLAHSVTMEQARSDLQSIVERLARDYPDTNRGIKVTIAPPMEALRRGARPFLMTLMGAVGFVLLIACANVANLLLARAATRSREIAIRASLGATRWRIVRQLLLESVLLASLAGVLGLILSVYGVRYFGVAFDVMEVAAPDRAVTPYWVDLTMDGRVFAFVAALCLGTSLVFGLAPALHVSKTDINEVLKDSGPSAAGSVRARRWTGALMILELTLTLILLTGSGLLVRSFVARYRTDLVIDTTNLVTGRLALPAQQYRTPEEQRNFVARLDERLASNPALAAAAIASDVPLVSAGGAVRRLSIDGRPAAAGETLPQVSYVRVGAHYFETLGLRLVQGRGFTEADAAAGLVQAIVNQRFATMFFSGEDAVGRRIRLEAASPPQGAPAPWFTIVGVAPTLPQSAPAEVSPVPVVYVPFRAEPGPMRFVTVLARGRSGPATTLPVVREDIRALDPDLPLFAAQTLDDVVGRTRFPTRSIGALFGLLAINALVLASVGLFALTAHAVAQRTHEIGIRMALGARAAQVAWLFLRRTLGHLSVGLTLGLAGALAAGPLLGGFLGSVSPRDPLTLGCVVALLLAVSLVAAFLPARRAARLDPVVALRHE
jgi:putative ABC transport system permease protein